MIDRAQRIHDARQRQPLTELERKARKARRRNKTWTWEEIDVGVAQARDLIDNIEWE